MSIQCISGARVLRRHAGMKQQARDIQCTIRGIPREVDRGHTVEEARLHGWEELANGDLIAAAEAAGFEVLVTTEKNIRYQQNPEIRKIALVVLGNSQWPMVKVAAAAIAAAVKAAEPGSYVEVDVPFKP